MKDYTVKHGGKCVGGNVQYSGMWKGMPANGGQLLAQSRRNIKHRERAERKATRTRTCSRDKWVDAHKAPEPEREAVYVPKGVDVLTFLRSNGRV
jgi:hypothetical protein